MVGLGVVGTATASLLQRLGCEVAVQDISDEAVARCPGWCRPQPWSEPDFTFICTPESAVAAASEASAGTGLLVVRSTVVPGVVNGLASKLGRHVAAMPEFLRAAMAWWDVFNPNMVVIGQCCPEHGEALASLFSPLLAPVIKVDPDTAAMVKLCLNAYLPNQESFWN